MRKINKHIQSKKPGWNIKENELINCYNENILKITQTIESHLKTNDFYTMQLKLTIDKKNPNKKYINIKSEEDPDPIKINDSKFYFIWILCYGKKTENDCIIKRYETLSTEILNAIPEEIREHLNFPWTIEGDREYVGGQQSKMKTLINNITPNLIIKDDEYYILNPKISTDRIQIPYYP
ncbi:hypothetical protein KJ762_12080 [bacterium]|nr:hypothetical protein [bacterium]MBU1064705.1 hypothetical protein [bacterium]MBU1635231.1 hypothetical protein [bacterium]MBU1875473.1 hypothetical protein [bacterium]